MALNSWQLIKRVEPGTPFGNGQDGDYSSATIPTLVKLSCSGTSTSSTLTVSATSLSDGDLILIHQTRGTGVGQWEINKVASGGGTTTITTQQPLYYTYTDSGASQAQVIKIFQYRDVTVQSGTWTVPSWDGNVGGIFPIAAQNLITITGNIHAGGTSYLAPGYVGGTSVGQNTNGRQGEGTSGAAGTQSYLKNGSGGGGGQGTKDAAGGGGGGSANAGTAGATRDGHQGGQGGDTSGNSGLTNMTLGGAGGSGGGDEDGIGSGTGGSGGGIIVIYAKTLSVSGNLYAYGGYGTAGSNPVGTNGMGGGGGGGGGSLLICGQYLDVGTSKTNLGGGAAGAGGGTGGETGSAGGAGSSGRIAVYYGTSLTGTVSNYGSLTSERDTSLILPVRRSMFI